MIFKGTSLEDLKKNSVTITNPNKDKNYTICIKAYALQMNKQYEEAINLYKKALKHNKKDIEALKGISLCYKSLNEYDMAIKYYNNIKLLMPFDKTVYYELGILEYERQDYITAIKYFIKAIKLAPEYYDAIYALGQSHEALEEYDMAEMIYLKILDNRPSYLMAYNRLANMYLQIDEYQKAIKFFKDILNINPDFHRAYLGMAIAYEKNQRIFESKKYYKKYLEYKPHSTEREYILEKLKSFTPGRNEIPSYLSLVK